MPRYLPFIIPLALMIFALVHCIQAGDDVRRLPRWGWIAFILLVPGVGAIVYLLAGRPATPRQPLSPHGPVSSAPRGPDDDPDFLAGLGEETRHEQMLREWEEQLRAREEDLREDGDSSKTD